jgi:hypothetical protein
LKRYTIIFHPFTQCDFFIILIAVERTFIYLYPNINMFLGLANENLGPQVMLPEVCTSVPIAASLFFSK